MNFDKINYNEMSYDEKKSLALSTSDVKIQEILVKDTDWDVRFNLVKNLNLNIKIQEILCKDIYAYIRIGIAENLNIDIKIQQILSVDSNANVRFYLVQNPNIDCNILFNLIFDSDTEVGYEARLNLYNKFEKCSSEIKTYIINNLDLFNKK